MITLKRLNGESYEADWGSMPYDVVMCILRFNQDFYFHGGLYEKFIKDISPEDKKAKTLLINTIRLRSYNWAKVRQHSAELHFPWSPDKVNRNARFIAEGGSGKVVERVWQFTHSPTAMNLWGGNEGDGFNRQCDMMYNPKAHQRWSRSAFVKRQHAKNFSFRFQNDYLMKNFPNLIHNDCTFIEPHDWQRSNLHNHSLLDDENNFIIIGGKLRSSPDPARQNWRPNGLKKKNCNTLSPLMDKHEHLGWIRGSALLWKEAWRKRLNAREGKGFTQKQDALHRSQFINKMKKAMKDHRCYDRDCLDISVQISYAHDLDPLNVLDEMVDLLRNPSPKVRFMERNVKTPIGPFGVAEPVLNLAPFIVYPEQRPPTIC
jgi:hypothetical protein